MVETEQIERIRDRVSGLIDKYGNTVSLISSGTTSQDAWGEISHSSQTTTNTVGVTDNKLIAQMRLGSFGRLKDGESIVVIKGTETIDENYTVQMDSTDYAVSSIEELKSADVVVAYSLIVAIK